MKRTMLVLMIVLASTAAFAQDLADFQAGFETFAVDMAATLSYNATVGNNWSDAYIGQFPHLGAGIALGATAIPAASLKGLFDSMGETMPAEFDKYGLPIPAAAVAVKLGGFVLPFDVGLKAMILPTAVTEKLSAVGVAADYKLFGGNVRVGLVKEGILFPDVSVGVGYNRLSGSMLMPLDIGAQSFSFDADPGAGTDIKTLAMTDPDLSMDWTTDSFDFTLQVSKSLLFIRPFIGAGLSMGKSTVTGGMSATMTYDDGGGAQPIDAATLAQLKADLVAAGIAVPDISADGFMFSAENTDPVFRVYGGVSLDLIFLSLDLQGIYVPKSKGLGASAMIRFQL